MLAGHKRKSDIAHRLSADKKHKSTRPHSDGFSDEELHDEAIDTGDDSSASGTSYEEQDTWNGLRADEAVAPPAGERKGSASRKPPTGEELKAIKDAADLYMSSSFKLKIDALLPKVRPKYERFAALDKFLLQLHSFLTTLPPVSAQHPLAAARSLAKQGIAVPYVNPQPSDDTNWKVAFEKPQEVVLVGSWATKVAVKRKDNLPYVVDLAVEMPDSLLQEKDYLNNRFFHKRAYYLSVIAAALNPPPVTGEAALKKRKSKYSTEETIRPANIELYWESLRGDPRLTSLVIRQKPDGSHLSALNVQIRIIATLSRTCPIALNRLSPRRSNIRTSQSSASPSAASHEGEAPTPIYNSLLLSHTTARGHLLHVYSLQKTIPAFKDALTLLKVWANQRGYGDSSESADGTVGQRWTVRGFEGAGSWWVAVLDYLVNGGESVGEKSERRKPLGRGLSSYQLFRAALDFLSKHKWSQQCVFLKTDVAAEVRFPPQEFECNERTAVVADPTSGVNFLSGVPLTSLEMLSHDARVTLGLLDTADSFASKDPFDDVFLTDKRSLQSRFDVVVSINLSNAQSSRLSSQSVVEQGSTYSALLDSVSSTLRDGLGNRARAIAILHLSAPLREVNDASSSNAPTVLVGINLDRGNAYRLVDLGPPAAAEDGLNDPYAEERRRFRSLWGQKAEIRRFKDGRILESVVWEVSSSDERTHIPFLICSYLLQRRFGLGNDAVQWSGGSWDRLLKINPAASSLYHNSKVEIGHKAAMSAFDGLVKTLKSLDDELPLAILNVSPVSSLLRQTSVFNPVAVPPTSPLTASTSSSALPTWARFVPAMEVIIEFEKSGRWPDELKAIQKVKLAFLEAIAASLGNKIKSLLAQVVLDDDTDTIRDTARLEVLTPDGWAFSARIWHDREGALLDDMIDDKPHIPQAIKRHLRQDESPQDANLRHAAAEAKETYTRRYVHGPRHHRAVAILSHRHGAYSSTVRLVKRWFASHWLLGGHIAEEAVEMLCATVFLGAGPHPLPEWHKDVEPSTKERGFALVMQFLATWEWENGLFVPMYGSEAGEDLPHASSNRPVSATGRGAWLLRTERDSGGRVWTSHGPDAVVARRVKDVAKATWAALQTGDVADFDAKILFIHPTEHYDILVYIDPIKAPRYMQNLAFDNVVSTQKSRYVNVAATPERGQIELMPGFDPVQMLYDDLKSIYEDTYKIFFDTLGGTTFGILFDPSLKTSRSFRVRGGYNSVPANTAKTEAKDKDKTLVTLNVDSVLSEIERLGSGLVARIALQE